MFKVLNLDTNWTVRKTDSRPFSGQLVGNCSGAVRSFQTSAFDVGSSKSDSVSKWKIPALLSKSSISLNHKKTVFPTQLLMKN